ncbi:three-helix bundle dimerization domain-containing protein [Mycolicibacterium palauense]|uniref:three-helix bundle dimerization domain-containing protein n=1 Tax=Mycolicibacterium palauense TaxID=2034511 RepID=UPI001145E38F|nr:hypothetical protein [Mycolicibacterium palauense]
MSASMDEQTLVAEVIERLAARYPALSAAEVADVVHEVHAAFNGAPLREYVPLFVERRARSALGELSVSYA